MSSFPHSCLIAQWLSLWMAVVVFVCPGWVSAQRHALTSNTISLSNSQVHFQIKQSDKNVWFSSIRSENSFADFIALPAKPLPLWEIEVRSAEKQEEGLMLKPADANSFWATAHRSKITGRTGVNLCWRGVTASAVKGSFDVEVTGELERAQTVSQWKIRVSANSTSHGVWEVCFPQIDSLREGSDTHLVPHGYGGFNPTQSKWPVSDAKYPSAHAPMQFSSVTSEGTVLYLGSHDPEGGAKRFRITREGNGIVYRVFTPASDMGRPGVSFEQPYPFALGAFLGDWFDAAKTYRAWGEKNARSFAQGKLSNRKDVPQWFKELPAWVLFNGLTEANMKHVEDWKKFLGTPLAVHVYHWYQHAHDTKYPDFLPPFAPFQDYMSRCQQAGIKVVPYINAHLIDQNSAFYKDQGREELLAMPLDRKLHPSEEWKGDGTALNFVACPSVPAYQKKIVDLTESLVRDYGVDGVYFDQVACVPPHPCFNSQHGHGLGGMGRWVSSYRGLIASSRKRMTAAAGKPVAIVSESCAESHPFDAWLRCNEGVPWFMPLHQAVYSGYRLNYGLYFTDDEFKEDDGMPAIVKVAHQLVWGYQLGWFLHRNEFAEYPGFGRFIRDAVQARSKAHEYLSLGEMMRPVVIETSIPTVQTMWRNFSYVYRDWKFAGVMTSSWKAEDGTVALVFANITSERQSVEWSSTRAALGMGKKKLRSSVLHGGAEGLTLVQEKGDFVGGTVVLEPLSSAIVKIEVACGAVRN